CGISVDTAATEKRLRSFVSTETTDGSSGSSATAAYPGWVLLYYYGQHEADGSCGSAAEAEMAAAGGGAPRAPPPATPSASSSASSRPRRRRAFACTSRTGPPRRHTPPPPSWRRTATPCSSRSLSRSDMKEEVKKTTRSTTSSTTPAPTHGRRRCHLRSRLVISPTKRAWRHRHPALPGEEEFVVAELKTVDVNDKDDACTPKKATELLLLCSGEWTVQRPTIRHHTTGEVVKLPPLWKATTVIPVPAAAGDEQLCWVDKFRGLIFSNVFDETPELRYVPPPVDHPYCSNACITGGGSVIKFVNIFARCCCGRRGATKITLLMPSPSTLGR
ncbi:hypothetical protein EJB05_29198, partial [Eragrostis curvula]